MADEKKLPRPDRAKEYYRMLRDDLNETRRKSPQIVTFSQGDFDVLMKVLPRMIAELTSFIFDHADAIKKLRRGATAKASPTNGLTIRRVSKVTRHDEKGRILEMQTLEGPVADGQELNKVEARFTVIKDFFSPELSSQYSAGQTYDVRTMDTTLAALVPVWVGEGKVTFGAEP